MLVVVATNHANDVAHWRAEAARWEAEAARWEAKAKRLAADDARLKAENAALKKRVSELEAQVAALSERVATLAKLVFGTSSEKKKPGPPVREQAEHHEDDKRRPRGQQPGSTGHGRRDYSGLETLEVVHDVTEDERVCPVCGAPYKPFDEERSEQIDWQVRIVRVVHRRPSYRRSCRCNTKGILVAPVPEKPIAKGRFTAGFLARLLLEKYVLGRPIERIVAALEADGFSVAKGTLVGALQALSELLAPLDAAIRARNALAGHLHIDETSWRVFETVADKENHRWWLWVFVGSDTTVFHIDPTRSAEVAESHLGIDISSGKLEGERRLLVSSDFYTVYQSLASVDGVDPLWCWAHIRRYFIRAADAHKELKPWAKAWLERIGALYVAHRALGAADAASAAHAKASAQFATALAEIDTARKKEAADESLHPRAAKVLATLDHEWEGLARHEAFPELPLDNNVAERAVRGPVVGRKNYYGSGSVWASVLAARVWTITASASRAGCNPLAYLVGYLDACAKAGGRPPSGKALSRFFPWAISKGDLATWSEAPRGPSP